MSSELLSITVVVSDEVALLFDVSTSGSRIIGVVVETTASGKSTSGGVVVAG